MTDPHGLSSPPAQPSNVWITIFPQGEPYFWDIPSGPDAGRCGVVEHVNIYFYFDGNCNKVDFWERILPLSIYQNNYWINDAPGFADNVGLPSVGLWPVPQPGLVYNNIGEKQDLYNYFGYDYVMETQTQYIYIGWPAKQLPQYRWLTRSYDRHIESYAPFEYIFYTELYEPAEYKGVANDYNCPDQYGTE
jgi:hypothetical protein